MSSRSIDWSFSGYSFYYYAEYPSSSQCISAIFYLYISLEFLREMNVEGEYREDAARLQDIMTVVVWFLAICSIVRIRYLYLMSTVCH